MENMFNGMFGKIQSGLCRLSYNGDIAIRCSDGKYKAWNSAKGRLTNTTGFVLPIADDFFFLMPTNKVKEGDIIIANGLPKCVISTNGKTIQCVNYEDSTVENILPERHVFMGQTYFYGKIVSLMGKSLRGGKGIGKMMKLMLMSQMMGGKNPLSAFSGGSSDGNSMLPLMMLMGGGFGDMSDMFDFGLDEFDESSFKGIMSDDDEEEEDEEEEDDEEEVKPVKKSVKKVSKKSTKK